MSTHPHVSVLILNLNGLEDTKMCVRSLLEHHHPNAEILVLDNGSKTNEADLLQQEFGDAIQVFRVPQNLGYAGGNNELARHAVGDILLFLNNDTEVTKNWLQPLMRAFADPGIVSVQSKLRSWFNRSHFDHTGACGGYLDHFGFPYSRGRIFDTVEEDRGQYDSIADIDWACGAAFAVRADAFKEVGMFDDRLFAYMEEVDLSLRLRRFGRIVCVPASVVYHKSGQTLRSRLGYKRFLAHRNSLLVLAKHSAFPSILWLLPLRLALECAACLYYGFTGEWRFAFAVLRSIASFLFHLPAFLWKRDEPVGMPKSSRISVTFDYFVRGRRTWDTLPKLLDR